MSPWKGGTFSLEGDVEELFAKLVRSASPKPFLGGMTVAKKKKAAKKKAAPKKAAKKKGTKKKAAKKGAKKKTAKKG
jgi:hypothetical protein